MVKSLEELKRENARLKAKREVQEDFRKRNIERRKIAAENRRLKRPKTFVFARGVRRAVIKGSQSVAKGTNKFVEKQGKLNKKKMKKAQKKRRKFSKSDVALSLADLI